MADPKRNEEKRPDPDALLALAGDGKGRFTLFLGAAPGVGKTYAMLSRAQRLKGEGVDIVVGLAETHGRSETASLLDGLETLPRRLTRHNGRAAEEFDLDAALRRKPDIIIVDELAHSNVGDSRHPKRHQDIEELLDAGIDVWSAMNVQHLESLSDVVQQITGVNVRERVPDIVLKQADDILLVDLQPAELLERLKEGKVYLPENAQRAADGFFQLGNLTALREMALRRAADRVDDQVIDYRRQHAIEQNWPIAERLLVCIGPDPLSEKVIRSAARLASGLNASWIAVTIEHSDQPSLSVGAARQLDASLKLAESLGAETRRMTGNDFVVELMKLARREHATQIVIGASRNRFPSRLLRKSLPDALIEHASDIGIHVITGEGRQVEPSPAAAPRWRRVDLARQLGFPALLVVVASLIGAGLQQLIDLPNLSSVYLLAVLIAAVVGGHLAALVTALLSALAYNFFFIPPVETFTIASPHEVVGLVIFVIAALIGGGLASRLSQQATAASHRASLTQSLYDFSRKLSGTVNPEDVFWASLSHLRAALRRDVVLLSVEDGELQLVGAWPPDTDLSVSDLAAARWAMEKREDAGHGTGTLPACPFQFRPLTAPSGVVAIAGCRVADIPLTPEDDRMFRAILDQTAIAVDRARLSRESLDQAKKLAGDRFRSSLLSSVSHDLKTPLATITGAASTLRQLGDKLKPSSRDELLTSIEEEGERLGRFVSNLLDITKIEAGGVNATRDWVDVGDAVSGAIQRAKRQGGDGARFDVEISASLADKLPLVRGDSVLLSQTLFNLLDNALKYGAGKPVSVHARRDGQRIVISVTDGGKGIPATDLDRVFDKFYRRGKPDGRSPGTGLGLAIAKGFVEAMGGSIGVESPAIRKRGTRFTIRLPVPVEGTAGADQQ